MKRSGKTSLNHPILTARMKTTIQKDQKLAAMSATVFIALPRSQKSPQFKLREEQEALTAAPTLRQEKKPAKVKTSTTAAQRSREITRAPQAKKLHQ